jgi:hypothetical protein
MRAHLSGPSPARLSLRSWGFSTKVLNELCITGCFLRQCAIARNDSAKPELVTRGSARPSPDPLRSVPHAPAAN